MDCDDRTGGLPADVEEFTPEAVAEEIGVAEIAPATTTTAAEDGDDMAKTTGKKKATVPKRKAKKATKKGAVRTAKTKRSSAKMTPGTRRTMRYAISKGIPDTLRNPSAARSILEAIKTRGAATKKELASDLGPKFPDPTLRFNLWKMTTAGILSVKGS